MFEDYWSCFTCNYCGFPAVGEGDVACCPVCGTHDGDGFGMAENDPRYRDAIESTHGGCDEEKSEEARGV